MLCLRNNHDRSWMRYGSRSKAHARRHCLGGALSKACNYVLTLWGKLTQVAQPPKKKRARIHFSAPIGFMTSFPS